MLKQMGESENEIYSGTQERFIYGVDDEGDFNQLSIGDRPNSIIKDRANNKGSSQEKQHRREPKVNRPVTMGGLDEQLMDYLDLYLIHWPMTSDNCEEENWSTWEALEKLYKEGKVCNYL